MSNSTNLCDPGGHGPHPPGGCRHLLAAAALAVACACSAGEPPANPIDRLLAPRLAALGLEMRSAEPHELCRRIAIDLLGRGPSPDELAACVAAGGAERIELAQAHEDHVEAARRAWSEILGYDTFLVSGEDLADLDARVADLAAGELTYAEFASAVVVHPAFVALHPYDEWARATIGVFLGRAAREDEVAALRPLSAAWHVRYLCEGGLWWGFYQELLEEGTPEPEAAAEASLFCADEAVPQVGFNPCQCQPDDGLLGCHSDALGEFVNLPVRCAEANRPYSAVNAFLIGPAPGGDDTCPDGTQRPECDVRETDESFRRLFAPVAWTPIDDEGRADLARIGAALTARPDFWEAAADRELFRLLGWWQTSFRHPDTDLPEVRALLADLLREGASLAEIQRIIMTSRLYAAPAAPPPGWDLEDGDPPPWSMGPTKLLAAEAWVDTLLLAVGETPGTCDVRAISDEGYAGWMNAPGELADPASSLDRIAGEEYYVGATLALGGCTSDSPRPTQSSVGLAFAQGEHARIACAYGAGVLPPGGAGDLRAAADRLVRRLQARPPADGELDQLVADMEACLAAGGDGCTDPEYAVRWLCQRLADSTEFATY